MPGTRRPSSASGTSARHSSRLPRIRRKSSWPGCVCEPTVAVRAEIVPSSGATTCVCPSRSSSACSLARAAASRAAAVCSSVAVWVAACGLMKPFSARSRERAALVLASASTASASATAARTCARSVCTVSGLIRASNWPFFTTSPTLTSTSVTRKPASSVPITASCHAVTLPRPASVRGHSSRCGVISVTVSAGRTPVAGLAAGAAGIRRGRGGRGGICRESVHSAAAPAARTTAPATAQRTSLGLGSGISGGREFRERRVRTASRLC